MNRLEAIDVIKSLAEFEGNSLHSDYSGRGMNGIRCYGVVTEDLVRVIEEAAIRGLRGALSDWMGKQAIVYWPKVTA